MQFTFTTTISGNMATVCLTNYDPAALDHRPTALEFEKWLEDSGVNDEIRDLIDNFKDVKLTDKFGVQIGAYPRPRP